MSCTKLKNCPGSYCGGNGNPFIDVLSYHLNGYALSLTFKNIPCRQVAQNFAQGVTVNGNTNFDYTVLNGTYILNQGQSQGSYVPFTCYNEVITLAYTLIYNGISTYYFYKYYIAINLWLGNCCVGCTTLGYFLQILNQSLYPITSPLCLTVPKNVVLSISVLPGGGGYPTNIPPALDANPALVWNQLGQGGLLYALSPYVRYDPSSPIILKRTCLSSNARAITSNGASIVPFTAPYFGNLPEWVTLNPV